MHDSMPQKNWHLLKLSRVMWDVSPFVDLPCVLLFTGHRLSQFIISRIGNIEKQHTVIISDCYHFLTIWTHGCFVEKKKKKRVNKNRKNKMVILQLFTANLKSKVSTKFNSGTLNVLMELSLFETNNLISPFKHWEKQRPLLIVHPGAEVILLLTYEHIQILCTGQHLLFIVTFNIFNDQIAILSTRCHITKSIPILLRLCTIFTFYSRVYPDAIQVELYPMSSNRHSLFSLM